MDEEKLRLLGQKRKLLLKRMAQIEDFVRGSVVLMKRVCTYAGCRRCASGERHPTWVLTVSRGGKTRTVYLGQRRVPEARRMVANHRRLALLVEEIGEINLILLTRRDQARKGPEHG